MSEKPKTLSRAYTFQRKVYTPHSVDVPKELLERDAKYLEEKAARQAAEDEAEAGTEGDDAAAPRAAARKKTAKRK